ncbi:hypothetical protein EBR03_09790 [bacterium]|nr:hypothetical protein [bacterium]NBW99846.1 hypothetical protein [bacterium]NBX83600.1 hypothetical protein [bacterium]
MFFYSILISAVQILTPIQKSKPVQLVPVTYELMSQPGRSRNPNLSGTPTLFESPLPGTTPIKFKQGSGKSIYSQESGALFEELDLVVDGKRRKRVLQRIVFGGPEVVSGQVFSLLPAARQELGRYFSENFRTGKTTEDFSRALFVLQTMDQKQVNFDLPCKFVKTHRLEILEKVQIKREIFELLLAGTCS